MRTGRKLLKNLAARGFEIEFHGHAAAILSVDFAAAIAELDKILTAVTIPISELIGSGGGEAAGTQRMRKALTDKGWRKTKFEIKKIVNGVERESISHAMGIIWMIPLRGDAN